MRGSVLQITLSSSYGGGPEYIYQVVTDKYIVEEFEVFIASPEDPPYFEIYKNLVGQERFYKLPNRKLNLFSLIGLVNFTKRNKIDIVHSHGKGAGIYGRIVSLLTGIPCVHTPHGIHVGKYNRVQLIFYILMEQLLSLWTKFVIHVSASEQEIAHELRLFRWTDKGVIENGVRLNDVQKHIRNNVRFQIGATSSTLVVTTVSRFDYAKNMGLAYKIASLCRDKDVLFVWVGDGEECIALKERVRNESLSNIVFVGFTSRVYEYLSASDVYLSTSRWEGMPLAVLEAMASQLPVLATNVVGNKDIVIHKESGYVFPIDEPEVAVFYLDALRSSTVRKRLGVAAKRLIIERYGVQRMCKDILGIYRKILFRKEMLD